MQDEVQSQGNALTFYVANKAYLVQGLLTKDLEQVCAIENAVYPFPWSLGNFKDSLVSGYDAWVVRETNTSDVMAYAVVMWIPDEAHLLNISVALNHQRIGLGSALLEWLMLDAKKKKATNVMLEVRPSNLSAVRLYKQVGFLQIGVRKGYYPNGNLPREDALVLSKSLLGSTQ
jgi:[ribosomal protein S18]-alanine N-acetyltransferase